MFARYMFCLFPKSREHVALCACDRAQAVSLSFFREMAFLYYETEDDTLLPTDVVTGELIPFPNGKTYHAMPDIFHYSVPTGKDAWARRVPGKAPWIRVNRVKPDMLSRYIYFHYQYQEERPGGGPDRYGSTFLYGNYIVHYLEWPFEPETHPVKGRLDTNMTPADDVDVWDSIMSEFFLPWEDCPFEWHPTTTVTPDGRTYELPANLDKLPQDQIPKF